MVDKYPLMTTGNNISRGPPSEAKTAFWSDTEVFLPPTYSTPPFLLRPVVSVSQLNDNPPCPYVVAPDAIFSTSAGQSGGADKSFSRGSPLKAVSDHWAGAACLPLLSSVPPP